MHAHRCVGLTVLAYHRVLPAQSCQAYGLPALVIPVPVFREQVQMLAEAFEVLPLGAALAVLASRRRRRRALMAITFDDGYADNGTTAAPILEQHGLRATFFPVTSFVAGHGPLWFDRVRLAVASADPGRRLQAFQHARANMRPGPAPSDPTAMTSWVELLKHVPAEVRASAIEMLEVGQATVRNEAPAAMSRADLAGLAQRGHEIGSHSMSHAILTDIDDARLHAELGRSRAELEQWTGTPVTGLCYPNGDHDDRVVRAAKAAGYRYACTTLAGLNAPDRDPHRLARTDITMARVCTADGGHDPAAFMAEVCGLHELLRWARNRWRPS